MDQLKAPPGEPAPGWSRRQVLCRLGGGVAAVLLGAAGLGGGQSEAGPLGVVSLRAALQQISGGCDPSHGIRLMLPVEGPVISLLDVIHNYYHP